VIERLRGLDDDLRGAVAVGLGLVSLVMIPAVGGLFVLACVTAGLIPWSIRLGPLSPVASHAMGEWILLCLAAVTAGWLTQMIVMGPAKWHLIVIGFFIVFFAFPGLFGERFDAFDYPRPVWFTWVETITALAGLAAGSALIDSARGRRIRS
jgi:hypothetical protein